MIASKLLNWNTLGDDQSLTGFEPATSESKAASNEPLRMAWVCFNITSLIILNHTPGDELPPHISIMTSNVFQYNFFNYIESHSAPLTTLFLSIQDVPGMNPADLLGCLYLSIQIESVFQYNFSLRFASQHCGLLSRYKIVLCCLSEKYIQVNF